MSIESKEMSTPEITLELSHFLNNAVKIMISCGVIGKVSDFASRCDIGINIMVNILNHRTVPTLGQLLSMMNVIRELSPEFAYKYFKQSLLGEF